jgi:hypothetical protein
MKSKLLTSLCALSLSLCATSNSEAGNISVSSTSYWHESKSNQLNAQAPLQPGTFYRPGFVDDTGSPTSTSISPSHNSINGLANQVSTLTSGISGDNTNLLTLTSELGYVINSTNSNSGNGPGQTGFSEHFLNFAYRIVNFSVDSSGPYTYTGVLKSIYSTATTPISTQYLNGDSQMHVIAGNQLVYGSPITPRVLDAPNGSVVESWTTTVNLSAGVPYSFWFNTSQSSNSGGVGSLTHGSRWDVTLQGAAAVPEPTTTLLGALTGLTLLRRRRR